MKMRSGNSPELMASTLLATHRPEAMLLSGNMETISQHSITTKLRLDLNGDAESPLSCSRANDRGRIDPPSAFGDRAWDWESCDRGSLDPVRCDGRSVGEGTQAEGCDGRSRVARC